MIQLKALKVWQKDGLEGQNSFVDWREKKIKLSYEKNVSYNSTLCTFIQSTVLWVLIQANELNSITSKNVSIDAKQ